MDVLIDTNVTLRIVDVESRQHITALHATAALKKRGDRPVIVPQTIFEFWTAATRSAQANGLGYSAAQATELLEHLNDSFPLTDDFPSVLTRFLDLVQRYRVTGTNAYDTRLVAAMAARKISHLLTFNASDFRRYDDVTILDPASLSKSAI